MFAVLECLTRRASRILRTSSTIFCLAAGPCAAFLTSSVGVVAADVSAQKSPNFAARWSGWAALGGAYGSDQSSYGALSIFMPLTQTSDSLLFTEIDGKFFEGDVLEANFAVGLRRMTASGFNLGIWTGLDMRDSSSDNLFGQVSGGSNSNNYGIYGGDDKSNIVIEQTSITNARVYGVFFWGNNSDITIKDMYIDAGLDGINLFRDNRNVTIADTSIVNAGRYGIHLGIDNRFVTIADTMVTDSGTHGIYLNNGNRPITITGTTVTNAGSSGIGFGVQNGVTVNDSILAGTFGSYGVEITNNVNTLNGIGNTAAGATFSSGKLCHDNGWSWFGQIEFDGLAFTRDEC